MFSNNSNEGWHWAGSTADKNNPLVLKNDQKSALRKIYPELEQKLRNGTITLTEPKELNEIYELDNARDVKLQFSCLNKLSTECRKESYLVDTAKASYSGSELTHLWGSDHFCIGGD